MKIAFLVTRLDKPSARYRVLQYLTYLQEHDCETHVFALPKKIHRRLALYRDLESVDIIFLQKKLLSFWDFFALRKKTKRLVYDYDDAVMFRDSWKSRQPSLKRRRAFERTVKRADWVIAGNEYLKSLAQAYTDRISILSTPVPLDRYQVKEHSDERAAVTLGWIGSAATVNYLIQIRDVLKELGEKYPSVRIKIVSNSFLPFEGIRVVQKQWSEEEEESDLRSFDIGLMPLTDDPWSRGKCGFKILQYMAAGIPVVCSPVGMNREIVQNGIQGFWATSGEEWRRSLSELIEDPGKRKSMGRAGRERVSDEYALDVNAPKLLEIIKSL